MRPDEVLLFPTCLVEAFLPHVHRSARRVLEHAGVQVREEATLTCCGQPAYNAGLPRLAQEVIVPFLQRLDRFPGPVVFLAGSCASLVRVEAPRLLQGTPHEELARRVAARTYEFSQFLVDVLGWQPRGRFPYRIAYHPSCHMLRVLDVDRQPRTLLQALEGVRLVAWPEEETCCGFGGLFSAMLPPLARAMGETKLQGLAAAGVQLVVTGDPGCLLHLQGVAGRTGPPLWHLAEVLDRALSQGGEG